MHILVVGAGLAGLTCARLLHRHGFHVTVAEASDGVGGRVRSDYANGYTFDRGFQVLFTAYPAVLRHINLHALDVRAFDPGAIICYRGQRAVLTDPLRDSDYNAALEAALTTVVSPIDKLRTLRLALQLRKTSLRALFEGDDATTHLYLQSLGFSKQIIDVFFRPFYGGIFLDRSLQTSAKCFAFDFKMLSDGDTVVPAQGIGQISEQLARELVNDGCVQLNANVERLITEGDAVRAILSTGATLHADAVVIATTAPEAQRLTQLPMPVAKLHTTTVYFCGDQPFYTGKKILLNADPDAWVNNAQLLTNTAPTYAPKGKHLLSVTLLDAPRADGSLYKRALKDVSTMFAGDVVAQSIIAQYQPLRHYYISYAQFQQPPGIHPQLPDNRTSHPRVYLAGEFTEASSLNAAMVSGEKCAACIVEDTFANARQ